MNNNEKQFEQFVRDIKFDDKPDYGHRDRLEQRLLSILSRQPRHKQQPLKIWRIIMKSRIIKLAAAAVIIIAVIVGINHLGGTISGSSVAWGRIAENVRQIDTFMFSLSIKVTDSPTEKLPQQVHAKWRIYLSGQYGFRMDIYANDKVVSWFVPAGSDTIITVIPDEKKWTKMPLSENQLQQAQQKEKDPREYIKRFVSRPYKQLGRATIDGIAVEGIEVNNPPTDGEPLENAVGRLWVDVTTQLPVRVEIEGTAEGNPVESIMDFRWSHAVDPSVFEPNIPPDYTSIG